MRRLALFALAAAAACATRTAPPPGAAGPVEAVQQLSAALQKGDTGTAWSLLSAKTRAQADELAAQARTAAGSTEPESGRQMLFGSALPQGPADTRLADEKGDVAHVQSGGRTFEVVREDGRWAIALDLRAAGKAPPPSGKGAPAAGDAGTAH